MRQSRLASALIFMLGIGMAHSDLLAQKPADVGNLEFEKLSIGPRIDVLLVEGEEADVRFEFFGIDPSELKVKQSGKTLKIYLDKARRLEKQKPVYGPYGRYKTGWYDGGRVAAYITYQDLSKLVVNGDQDVGIHGRITDDDFKLKGFGDLDIEIDEIHVERLKVKLYGDSKLTLKEGSIANQKYVLFGENDVDADEIRGQFVKATNVGECRIGVSPERLKLTAFGVTSVLVSPLTDVRKGIVIGETDISSW